MRLEVKVDGTDGQVRRWQRDWSWEGLSTAEAADRLEQIAAEIRERRWESSK